jgi:hypothetical protein
MKFIKTNAVVDAIRFDGRRNCTLVERIENGWRMWTPEGWRKVEAGDWIVTDASGTSWSIPHSVFTLLYEPFDGAD